VDAEEVGVEDGCEDSLLYDYFGENGEELGGEVEVIVEKHEPLHTVSFKGFEEEASKGVDSPVVRWDA
jgi:hypothetical protein